MKTKKKLKKLTLKKYLGGMSISPPKSKSKRKRNFGNIDKTPNRSITSNVTEASFSKEASFPQQLLIGAYKAYPMPENSNNEKFWENNYVRNKQYEYILSQPEFKKILKGTRDDSIKECYKYLLNELNTSSTPPKSKRLKSQIKGTKDIEKIKTHCLKLYNIAAPKGLGDISPWIMDFMVITRGNRIKIVRDGSVFYMPGEEGENIEDENFNNTYSTDDIQISNYLERMAYKESQPNLEPIDPNKISCLGANDLEPKALLFAGYQLVENSQGCFMMTKYMGYALIFINELIKITPKVSVLNFIKNYGLIFYLDEDGVLRVQYKLKNELPINRRISVACKKLLPSGSNIKNYELSDVKTICTIFNLALSSVSMDKIVGMLAIVGSTLTHDLNLELVHQKKMTFELLKMNIFPKLKKLEDVIPFYPRKNKTLEQSAINLFVLDVNVLNLYKMTTLADIIPIDSVNCSGLVMTIASSVEAVNVNNKVAGFGHEKRGAFATQKVLVANIWEKEPNNIKGLWMNVKSKYLPDCLNWNQTDSPQIKLYVPTRNGIVNITEDKIVNRLKTFFGKSVNIYIDTFLKEYTKYEKNEIYVEINNLYKNINEKKNLILSENVVNMIKLIVEYKGYPPNDLVSNIMVPYVEITNFAEVPENTELFGESGSNKGHEAMKAVEIMKVPQ